MSGHAPTNVTFNGKDYKVITNEAYTGKMINGKPEKVLPDRLNTNNNQYNANHAEKKLMSHITQQNQHGDISDVKINIQNTSKRFQGACYGCGGQDGMGGTIQEIISLNALNLFKAIQKMKLNKLNKNTISLFMVNLKNC